MNRNFLAIAALFGGCFLSPPPHDPYATIDQDVLNGSTAQVAQDLRENPQVLELKDSAGRTPLHLAVMHCHLEVAQLLLARHANPNSVAQGGATPLHLAAQEGCVNAIEALLAAHANLNARDDLGRTPLDRARQWHQAASVADLQRHGAIP